MDYLLLVLVAFAAGAILGVVVWHLAAQLQDDTRRARRLSGALASPRRDRVEPIPEWLQYTHVPDRAPLHTREALAEARRLLRPAFGIVVRVKP